MTSNFERFQEIQKNKQILKVTALYVIWNPKSVKCPASISENPVPLYSGLMKSQVSKFVPYEQLVYVQGLLSINLKYFRVTLGVANVPCLLFASYFVTCLGSKMDVTARSLQLQARAPPLPRTHTLRRTGANTFTKQPRK